MGTQFDTVWSEGAYMLREGRGSLGDSRDGGAQARVLAPSQGAFVEVVFPQAGHYPVVAHFTAERSSGRRASSPKPL